MTIVLTTHYIEEAQAMADRIGVIDQGKLTLVEEKSTLMRKLGKKKLRLNLGVSLDRVPAGFESDDLALDPTGKVLSYTFDVSAQADGVARFMKKIVERGVDFQDLSTQESSLEEIFVTLLERSS